ncbi:MAG: hypothetical protein ABII82_09795 [Verrucomicrobiota bacterium]
MNVRRLAVLLLCALAAQLPARATTAAEEDLAALVARQQPLLEQAAAKQTPAELEDLRPRFQKLVHDYEALLARHPGFAAAHASYGLLLANPVVGERKQAAVQLLAANRLDPDIPLVKNQLGNFLAEEGKPLEALHYYLEAVALAPREPLYHHQIGTLLVEARDTFIGSGQWTRQKLDDAMLDAFAEAADLAPDRFDHAYRHAMAHYDLAEPEWPAALELWRELQERAETAADRQLLQLHEANVLGKLGQPAQARALLRKVTEPALAVQKQKLLVELAPPKAPATVPVDAAP